MNNKNRQIIWKMSWSKYSVILIFLPALVVFLLMYLFTGQVSYNNLIPVWNDEVGWWGLVRNIVENINYPGHTGYNGEYARIGNFGPWGGCAVTTICLDWKDIWLEIIFYEFGKSIYTWIWIVSFFAAC